MTSYTWGSSNYYDVVVPARSYNYDNFDYYNSFRGHTPDAGGLANNSVHVANSMGTCVANTGVAETVMGVANNAVCVDNKFAMGVAKCVGVANTPVVGMATNTMANNAHAVNVAKIEGLTNNVGVTNALAGVASNTDCVAANSMAVGEASTTDMGVANTLVVDDVTVTSSCLAPPPHVMNTWYYQLPAAVTLQSSDGSDEMMMKYRNMYA